jgi:hypothetical protein
VSDDSGGGDSCEKMREIDVSGKTFGMKSILFCASNNEKSKGENIT